MEIKNNVVNITTMNTEEPHLDFSSSIINFRIHPNMARQGTPRPPPRFSERGEILNFLSNITAATENSTLGELLDISDNSIWNSAHDADVGNNDTSANFLHMPTALRSLLGSFGAGSPMNNIMNRSLHDEGGYKCIISEEGVASLKNKKYSVDACNNEACPITRASFGIGEEVVELPCKHCFNPEAINRWLNEEKAECPVCRYALKSKEIKRKHSPQTNVDEAGIRNARITLLNSLANTNNTVHPYGPRLPPIAQHRASLIVDNEDNEELQEAIFRSLRTS
jgi:hypothetical protein